MLKKINEKEIITLREAEKRHSESLFLFVYTENINYGGKESRGYVSYTFDKDCEFSEVSRDEWYGEDKNAVLYGIEWGANFNPEPYTVIGGIVYGDN